MSFETVKIGPHTLIHGDCMDVLPTLGKVDAVVTDPPYAGLKGGYARIDDRLGKRINPSVSVGDKWSASFEWTDAAKQIASFGAFVFCGHAAIVETANAFSDWRTAALLTWHKPNSAPTGANVPRFTEEYIWGFAKRPGLRWDGFKQTIIHTASLAVGCCTNPERILNDNGTAAHPTQKPLAVMEWILESADPCSVLDPFLGSGTTIVACQRTGRVGIGIEKERKYFDLACKRVEAEVNAFPLIEEKTPVVIQPELFAGVAA